MSMNDLFPLDRACADARAVVHRHIDCVAACMQKELDAMVAHARRSIGQRTRRSLEKVDQARIGATGRWSSAMRRVP
jgi:hypothetical protein